MNRDNHIADPESPWAFDEDVTNNFDAMLKSSIPAYDTMRELCYRLGLTKIQSGATVIDLGASRGEAVRRFIEHSDKEALWVNFELYEISPPMFKVLFDAYSDKPNVELHMSSITSQDFMAKETPYVDLMQSILTLQFTPIEYRYHIIDAIYRMLKPGGMFIFVEKVLGTTAPIDRLLVDEYHRSKRENGYSKEQIDNKRKALQGVLVPMTAKHNVDMLHAAGFRHVDCFYRNLNFAGWVAIK